MLHKADKHPVYGVRGAMRFFKKKSRSLPKEKGAVKIYSTLAITRFIL